MKKFIVILAALVIGFTACNKGDNNKFKTADSGLKYVFHESHPDNEKPQMEDVVVLHLSYETPTGTVLFNSANSDREYMRLIKGAAHPGGSFEDGLMMMHYGDSASFKINAYDFFKYTLRQEGLPGNLKRSDDVIIHVRLKHKVERESYGSQIDKAYHANVEKELELLKNYLEITNTTVEPTESGLYFISKEKGTGKQAMSGDVVSVHYTGALTSGKVFDSSITSEPFTFTLGKSEVIQGWDEGIAMMKVGGKAKLIIPSNLAYKDQGVGDLILPYSTLVFDVELISAK